MFVKQPSFGEIFPALKTLLQSMLQEQISFEEIAVLHTLLSFEEIVFYKEIVET
jgi:hypothetical protein